MNDVVTTLPCVPLPGDVIEVPYKSSKKGAEQQWVKVLVVKCLLPVDINLAGKRYHGKGIRFEVRHLDKRGTITRKKLLSLRDYPIKWRFPHDLSEIWIDVINGNTDSELRGKKKPYEEIHKKYFSELKRNTLPRKASVKTKRRRRIANWLRGSSK